MKRPIFVRPLTDAECAAMEQGLRSSNAFPAPQSDPQRQRTRRPHPLDRPQPELRRTDRPQRHPRLQPAGRALLHRRPRDFGHPTSLWTLDLAAEEAHQQGLTAARVSGETVRATLVRLGVRWLRAKSWITSPDLAYARKKGGATG